MATQSLPVSEIIRQKGDDFQDEPKKKTREDWRKAKELEEARKAGTAPAAVDEEGRDINPHIPQYISTAPWYFGAQGPTLKHQRPQPEKQKEFSKLDEWYRRGVDTSKLTIKYRPGACENCGALTHKKKECMERPRKVGARFTGADIAPDEFVQPILSMDYDGKRDRWNGYDPSEHRTIVDQYHQIEEAKRQLKVERMQKGMGTRDDEGADEGEEEDEDKYVEEADMPGTKVDSKQRITVRNLRIREDTAKYLRNLDPSSAYYDPKTRSMRDNPYKDTPGASGEDDGADEVAYAGENFVRFTGDTHSHSRAQLFAWEAYEKGVDVNLQAEPTKLEMLKKEFERKKEHFKGSLQQSVLEKYGGAEHLDTPPKQLLLAQSEDYVEYSRHGRIVKGQEKQVVSSRYEEDVLVNNHTAVWGSYWQNGRWGYKCCHSFVKNSYCTGDAGKAVSGVPILLALPESSSHPDHKNEEEEEEDEEEEEEEEPKTLVEMHREKQEKALKNKKKKEKKRKNRKKKKMIQESSSDSDSSSEEKKKKKLKKALIQEEFRQAQADKILATDERKRAYNSRYEIKAPTEEEMEAYYMKRARAEDPMADFLN